MFGNLDFSWGKGKPAATLPKHVEEIRNKLKSTEAVTANYKKKMQELNKLTKVLETGYINNLNIIVDMSTILNEYRTTLSEVLMTLKKFDDTLLSDLKSTDVEHIKDLASEQLKKVSIFFEKDVANIKSILSSLDKTDLVERLTKSQENFKESYNQGLATYAEFNEMRQQQSMQGGTRGRGSTRGKGKGRGRGRGRGTKA